MPSFVGCVITMTSSLHNAILNALCVLHLVANVPAKASNQQGEDAISLRFIDALSHVESLGKDHAVGDNGRAKGRFQVHHGTWSFISELRRRQSLPVYTYSHATNAEVAQAYVLSYFRHYEGVHRLAEGRSLNDTERLLIWQLGYAGARKINFDITRAKPHNRRAHQRLHDFLSTHGK